MSIEKKIRAMEKAANIELRPDQKEIVQNPGYPLFQLIRMTRCWGKTTVAAFWTLTHEDAPVFMDSEAKMWSELRNSVLVRELIHLPRFPDPDLLNHPIMISESFHVLRDLAVRCSAEGIAVPSIFLRDSFIDKRFNFVPMTQGRGDKP